MSAVFNAFRGMDTFSIILRMVCAFLLGGVIGLERSYKNKPAGFRTHILVCVGASIASMTGLYLYLVLKLPADVSRIGGQVITGISFIGAGFYEGAIIGTVLTLLIETYFSNIRAKIQHVPEFKIPVSYYQRNNLDEVLRHCKNEKMAITNLQIAGTTESDVPVYSALVTLRPNGELDHLALVKEIEKMEGVISAEEL
ncbi:MAG: MgtC/SapB family protein [Solobacterium sp.]|nr:MgtC/SapB family protein [Solobacterium sp.]